MWTEFCILSYRCSFLMSTAVISLVVSLISWNRFCNLSCKILRQKRKKKQKHFNREKRERGFCFWYKKQIFKYINIYINVFKIYYNNSYIRGITDMYLDTSHRSLHDPFLSWGRGCDRLVLVMCNPCSISFCDKRITWITSSYYCYFYYSTKVIMKLILHDV